MRKVGKGYRFIAILLAALLVVGDCPQEVFATVNDDILTDSENLLIERDEALSEDIISTFETNDSLGDDLLKVSEDSLVTPVTEEDELDNDTVIPVKDVVLTAEDKEYALEGEDLSEVYYRDLTYSEINQKREIREEIAEIASLDEDADYVSNEFVCMVDRDKNEETEAKKLADAYSAATGYDFAVKDVHKGIVTFKVENKGDVVGDVMRYSADVTNNLPIIEPNYLCYADGFCDTGNEKYEDPFLKNFTDEALGYVEDYFQWYHEMIYDKYVWEALDEEDEKSIEDSVVAVIDSGINYNHADLNVVSYKNYITASYESNQTVYEKVGFDTNGHGTNVAGIIGAKANSLGGRGVAPGIGIASYRALSRNGSGPIAASVCALLDVAEDKLKNGRNIRFVNMSLGSCCDTIVQREAIDILKKLDVVVLASAGNNDYCGYSYPAANDGVVGVASLNSKYEKSTFSNYGSYVDLAAPGGEIKYIPEKGKLVDQEYLYSTGADLGAGSSAVFILNGQYYSKMHGTSQATPVATGCAALVAALKPDMSSKEVIEQLEATATPLKSSENLGAGCVNVAAALDVATESEEPEVVVSKNGLLTVDDIVCVSANNLNASIYYTLNLKDNGKNPENDDSRIECEWDSEAQCYEPIEFEEDGIYTLKVQSLLYGVWSDTVTDNLTVNDDDRQYVISTTKGAYNEKEDAYEIAKGEKFKFKLQSNSNIVKYDKLTVSTDESNVLSIAKDGTITPISTGYAWVFIEYVDSLGNSGSMYVSVHVMERPKALYLGENTSLISGQRMIIAASDVIISENTVPNVSANNIVKVIPEDPSAGEDEVSRLFEVTSLDPAVLSVTKEKDKNGTYYFVLEALESGKATVKITTLDGTGISDSIDITVTNDEIVNITIEDTADVSLTDKISFLTPTKNYVPRVKVTYANGNTDYSPLPIEWSIYNESPNYSFCEDYVELDSATGEMSLKSEEALLQSMSDDLDEYGRLFNWVYVQASVSVNGIKYKSKPKQVYVYAAADSFSFSEPDSNYIDPTKEITISLGIDQYKWKSISPKGYIEGVIGDFVAAPYERIYSNSGELTGIMSCAVPFYSYEILDDEIASIYKYSKGCYIFGKKYGNTKLKVTILDGTNKYFYVNIVCEPDNDDDVSLIAKNDIKAIYPGKTVEYEVVGSEKITKPDNYKLTLDIDEYDNENGSLLDTKYLKIDGFKVTATAAMKYLEQDVAIDGYSNIKYINLVDKNDELLGFYTLEMYPCGTEKVVVDKTNLTLEAGKKYTLSVNSLPKKSCQRYYKFSSSNTKVAKVNENGTITAVSNGKANITVTAGDGSGKKSVCQVNVITKVNHMEITSSTGLFTFSKSLKVTAQSNADASNKNFKYEIVAPLGASYMPSDYLTINSKTGQIKSKVNVEKPIYFMVRALALDGSNMIAEHEIILVKKTNGLNIFPKKVTLFTGMGSTPIELTGTQNTIGFDGYKVTVSNKKVVTAYIKDVNAEVTEGTHLIITPVAKGTATIKLKALDGTGKTQTIKVTVNNPVRELNISSKNGTDTITLGKSITLKANVNKDATNKKVKWELVNPMDSDFAKLTQSGKLTLKSIPIKGNSVTVKATTKDGTNISDTFTVNIAEFCAKSINVYDSAGVKAKKFKLSTSACPNGTLVTNVNVSVALDGNYVDRYRKVVAISSDESIVSATYEDNGIFNIMSGYKTGKATVKFIANDGSNKSVSVTVNVVRPVLTLKIATATGYDYLSDGSTLKLSTYANDATNKSVKWSAEGANKELVSVDSKGVVKVTQPITRNTDVIIRATAVDGSGVYDEKVLTLVPKQGNISVLVYAIENGHKVIKNVSTMKVGETVEMYFLGDENVLNDYKVTYNDELARVQYVTPDPNLISGCNTAVKITAKKAGTLKIKATAKDGSGKSVTYSIAVK